LAAPPCQGFSTSNQTNRDAENENNWLFREYLRLVSETRPEWVVFENVKGLLETEDGYFLDAVLKGFKSRGYTSNHFVLNSADYGVPQTRNRLFIVASLSGVNVAPSEKNCKKFITVEQAFKDLPDLENGSAVNEMAMQKP
jgi:DNA (cytosine-5)-methyltransferase 1